MSKGKQCIHVLGDGRQCAGFALRNSNLCFSHNPHSRAAKRTATRKGGRFRIIKVSEILEPVEIGSPRDIIKLLAITVKELRAGKILPQIANTTGFLAAQLLRAFESVETRHRVDEFNAVISARRYECQHA